MEKNKSYNTTKYFLLFQLRLTQIKLSELKNVILFYFFDFNMIST